MTDIIGNVIGIQGNPVSENNPLEGQLLTWSQTDGYWVPKNKSLNTIFFTSNDTWMAPDNINCVLIEASGGGGGGAGSSGPGVAGGPYSGGGGGGALPAFQSLDVNPGETYSIIIGSGGTGGFGASGSAIGGNGTDGNSTQIIDSNSIRIFEAVGGGGAGGGTYGTNQGQPGSNIANYEGNGSPLYISVNLIGSLLSSPGSGGEGGGGNGSLLGIPGSAQPMSKDNVAIAGANPYGGGGGGSGSKGPGGNGGDHSSSTNGGNGNNASASTGAGGGGGGGSTHAGSSGGSGGTGGSGYLKIIW